MHKILSQFSSSHLFKYSLGLSKLHRTFKLSSRFARIYASPRTRLVTVITIISPVSLLFVMLAILHFSPKQMAYSYDKTLNCTTSPTLFPRLIELKGASSFKSYTTKDVSLLGYPLYSQQTCFTAISPVDENHSERVSLAYLGNNLLKKNITLRTSSYPVLSYAHIKKGPLSTKDPLEFKISNNDQTFSYQLESGEKTSKCENKNQNISCDVSLLQFKQSESYSVKLHRFFNDKKVSQIFESTITTVAPIEITSSSIGPGATVFDKPSDLTLDLNKKAVLVGEITLVQMSGVQTNIPIASEITESGVKIIFKEELAREATFKMTIPSIIAEDKGFLPNPHTLEFKTSGGPNVNKINIGTYGISQSQSFVVSFDQSLNEMDYSNIVDIKIGSQSIPAKTVPSNNRLTITPNENLPFCASFSININGNLENQHGVPRAIKWSRNSRTICHTVATIGYSVSGRAIQSYRFGSGPSKVIFVGGTHGTEGNTKWLLDSWVDELEAYAPNIPPNRTVIVIPNINPDGYATGTRTNANNVDLNRNFPANNWKAGVKMPTGEYLENGGGNQALSEPESSALANFILKENPRMVLTYHSQASLVVANESGDSLPTANTYGSLSNYASLANSQLGNTFNYDTTGAFEDWLHDKDGIPALLVELATFTSNEFSRNKNAMWAMVNLP